MMLISITGQISPMFHYGQALRQRHALLAAHRAILEIGEDESLEKELNARPSILVFDELKDPQVYSAEEYLLLDTPKPHSALQSGSNETSAVHYQDRINALVDRFVRSGFKQGQRLVEVYYPVGSEMVRVISMYQRLECGCKAYDAAAADEEGGAKKGVRLCTVSLCVTALDHDDGEGTDDEGLEGTLLPCPLGSYRPPWLTTLGTDEGAKSES